MEIKYRPQRSKFTYGHIPRPEQELAVKVGFLNDIHVCDNHFALRTAAQAYHSPVFEHLTADGTGSNLQKHCISLYIL